MGNDELSLDQLKQMVDEPAIVRVVNLIISQAINDRATAIHIERSRVRYRVDGVLYEVMNPPEHIHPAVVCRIKIMSNMDIAERRVPQDGGLDLTHDGSPYRLRVSLLPCDYGEKIVIKIQPKEVATLLELDQLGLSPENLSSMHSLLQRRSGLLLVTGFSRGGKSTTMYACMREFDQVERNLQTIEDPIKVRLTGVNQTEIHWKVGLTFASALRACLRNDPDVIMVGNLNCAETCRLAVDAACERYLVLAGCNTSCAVSSVMRLIHYGIEPYLISRALNGALSQRLARRICSDCKTSQPAPPGFGLDHIFTGAGCPACSSVGVRGQVGIQELLLNNPAIQDCLMGNPDWGKLHQVACEQGMVQLREDGLQKVAAGLVSLDEMLRVTRD